MPTWLKRSIVKLQIISNFSLHMDCMLQVVMTR